MKYMLIIASVVALAFASPASRGQVNPGAPGSAPIPNKEPFAIGPAILEYQPIAVGPAYVENDSVVGPTPVFPDVAPPVAPSLVATPLIQIIFNIKSAGQLPIVETSGEPAHVVENPPVEVVPAPKLIIPEPVAIGVTILPNPAVILPEELNLMT